MSNFVNLLDIIYPVGSVYITATEVSPASSIGGTWVEIKDKVLLDRTDENCLVEKGSMTHKHRLGSHGGAMIDIWMEGTWANFMYTYTDRLSFNNPSVKHALHVSQIQVATPAVTNFKPVQLIGYTDDLEAYPAYLCVRIYRRTA